MAETEGLLQIQSFQNFSDHHNLTSSRELPPPDYGLVGVSNLSDYHGSDSSTSGGSTNSVLIFEFLIQGLAITLVSILGLAGNILSVATFSRMRRKSSFTCFLLGLSFCDSVLVISSIFIFGLPSTFKYWEMFPVYTEKLYPYLILYLYPIALTAQTGSVYFTLVVTIERYFAVCHPLQSRCSRFMATWKRGIYLSVVILLFSIGFNIPRWLEYRIEFSDSKNGEDMQILLETTDLKHNPKFVMYYVHYAYFIVLFAVPTFLLVVLNSVIYKQIQKSNRIRQELTILQTSEIKLASMLVCIVVVFLLCNILPLVNNLTELLYDHVSRVLVYLGNLLVAFNCSINFLIYYSFGERFRRYFQETVMNSLCCCCFNVDNMQRKSGSSMYHHHGEMNDLSTDTYNGNRSTVKSRISISVISNGSLRGGHRDIQVQRHPRGSRSQSVKVQSLSKW